MKRALGLALLSVLGPTSAARAHGTSKSYADWRIEGRRVVGRIVFAAHDVVGARPGLDADQDGALSAAELAEHAAGLSSTLAAGASVTSGEGPCPRTDASLRGVGDPVEEIQLGVAFECPALVVSARVRARLLPELEPPHVSVATFEGRGLLATHVFTAVDPQVDLQLEPPPLLERLAASPVFFGAAGALFALAALGLALAWRRRARSS